MHRYLKELLLCPRCKHDLQWDTFKEDDVHIIDADAGCAACGEAYFVKDGVGCFLLDCDKNEDNWQKGDAFLERYFQDMPEAKAALLLTPPDWLNAADLYALASLLQSQGDEAGADKISKIAFQKTYTPEYRQALERQLNFISKEINVCNGFVLDIASGTGALVEKLLKNTELDIIASDISYSIMRKSRARFKEEDINRISFMAFDANFIPFKDRSLPLLTTFLGLQNINDWQRVLKELRRVCCHTFYAAGCFIPKEDTINLSFLKSNGIDRLWIKELLQEELKISDWNVECLYSAFAPIKPTPMGEIVQGYGIDGFPLADSCAECCVLKMQ